MMRYASIMFLFFLSLPILGGVSPDTSDNYMSLKSDEVNMRVGPGKNYPITWVFRKKSLPVRILAVFQEWYKVKTHDGSIGWMHRNMLTKTNHVLIDVDQAILYDKPSLEDKVIATVGKYNTARCNYCTNGWCKVKIDNNGTTLKGYIQELHIWGPTTQA